MEDDDEAPWPPLRDLNPTTGLMMVCLTPLCRGGMTLRVKGAIHELGGDLSIRDLGRRLRCRKCRGRMSVNVAMLEPPAMGMQ